MAVELAAATRASALARWQTDHVTALLAAAGSARGVEVRVPPVVVETTADRRLDIPIWELGGKGVFVKEVQAAVLDGRARIAVHSGKDLPAVTHPELVIAAVPERADPRDVLVGAALADLRAGATIATGSVRRRAQLAWHRPDLTFAGLRGNIATRLERIPPGGAIVMAAAALDRLGLTGHLDVPVEVLDPTLVLPQVAQGALVVECRADDPEAREWLAALDHGPTRRAVEAERGFLAELGGDCDLPAGAHARFEGVLDAGPLVLDAFLAGSGTAGAPFVRHVASGDDPADLGTAAARHLRRALAAL